MTSSWEYIGGLLLCLLVSLIYTLARKEKPKTVLWETLLVFVYTLGAISAVVLIVLLACQYK